MGHLTVVATCNLNQWALDFEGNTNRIIQSIHTAKERGASLRVGPELEITGYGCQDHFLEGDTYLHSWEMLCRIINDPGCQDIYLDIGMPVIHKNVRYNCRIIIHNKKILLIRPKLWLANDGNYREMRFFTPWQRTRYTEEFYLPRMITAITGQEKVPIGDAVISTPDSCFAAETCEELFTPDSPHVQMSLDGVEIFTNSSGSHHELRKLNTRIELITGATKKCGGIYLYANQQGCDGDRLYFDGCALIVVNGKIVAQGTQFSLSDVEVITATVDLEEVRNYRGYASRAMQSTTTPIYKRIEGPMSLSKEGTYVDLMVKPTPAQEPRYHIPEEEIALGPACWLWDYLNRSGAAGYFLPLSGGIDSCATATIVHSMCRLVIKAIENDEQHVLSAVRRICKKPDDWIPKTPQEIAGEIFHTTFMGTSNSSNATRSRAKEYAEAIGAYHVDLNMDSVVSAVVNLFTKVTGKTPQYKVHGGTQAENLALQNIQARLRMVLSYLFAQLLPWTRSKPGSLLVLGSANVDEANRGYLTKYDCSSADLNPIGSISKTDLKGLIAHAQKEFNLPTLADFLNAEPTAELEPITHNYVQSDEADMGFTYTELSVFGKLRKLDRCGPWSAFTKLLHLWSDRLSPSEIAKKTKDFYYYYAVNRHKLTVLTPSYHAEQYSPDDNRFDLRPFLYPRFTWAWKKIDGAVEELERKGNEEGEGKKEV